MAFEQVLEPVHDGAVLPILHLNGYKIANPTLLARIDKSELQDLLTGYGHYPIFVEGEEPDDMHRKMAVAVDAAFSRIDAIQSAARDSGLAERPHWPMIVLRSPKGWTGPKEVDGKKTEGFWRSHQVPITDPGRMTSIAASWRTGCAAMIPTACSMVEEGCARSWKLWHRQVTGAWEPTPMPTAAA